MDIFVPTKINLFIISSIFLLHYGARNTVDSETSYCVNWFCPLFRQKCSEYWTRCIPVDATYCNNEEYCPHGKKCTVSGDGCVPESSMYCINGGIYCHDGEKCSVSGMKCLPENVTDCLLNGTACGNGQKCPSYGGECIPEDAIECSNKINYCSHGQKCARFGNLCLPANSTDCSTGAPCPLGQKCPSFGGNCIPENASECKNGRFCPFGEKCTHSGDSCHPENATYCGGKIYCYPGERCIKSNEEYRFRDLKPGDDQNRMEFHCVIGEEVPFPTMRVIIGVTAAILIICFIIVGIRCALAKYRIKHPLKKVSSQTTLSNIKASIREHTNSSNNFELTIERKERPELDPVSTFADNYPTDELDHHWKVIERKLCSIKIDDNEIIKSVMLDDMEYVCELGRGSYGTVTRRKFKGIDMAVKQIRLTSSGEDKRALMDLKVLMLCKCPQIVKYYGYMIDYGYMYVFMEALSTSFWDILCTLVLKFQIGIPENVVGKVALNVVRGLEYLRKTHKIMHRDIKPSNILLGCCGSIKICDFGISGKLKESRMTNDVGSLAYLAPERISSRVQRKSGVYDIKADVWSIGVTVIELASAHHPFDAPDQIEMLNKVKHEQAVVRNANSFSSEFRHFYEACLLKEFHKRPNFKQLLETSFLKIHSHTNLDVWQWYSEFEKPRRNTH